MKFLETSSPELMIHLIKSQNSYSHPAMVFNERLLVFGSFLWFFFSPNLHAGKNISKAHKHQNESFLRAKTGKLFPQTRCINKFVYALKNPPELTETGNNSRCWNIFSIYGTILLSFHPVCICFIAIVFHKITSLRRPTIEAELFWGFF